jgi:protein ImuA
MTLRLVPSAETAPPVARARILAHLRETLARAGEPPGPTRDRLTFGCPELDHHLPGGGLAPGRLHEIRPASEAERPQGIAAALALAARIPSKNKPLLIVSSPKGMSPASHLSGHGMKALGLDPQSVLIARAPEEKAALWAIEEALRSRAASAVIGCLGRPLDLKTSQRLGAALQGAPVFLFAVTPPHRAGATIAATRWEVRGLPALRDDAGLMARWRWQVRLARCRNGREGEWSVEWDHDAHRFRLAAAMAHLALPEGGAARRAPG